MSPEEHYFENLLFSFAKNGKEDYDKMTKNDCNISYFTEDVKQAIETCAIYIIDCCQWNKDKVSELLSQ